MFIGKDIFVGFKFFNVWFVVICCCLSIEWYFSDVFLNYKSNRVSCFRNVILGLKFDKINICWGNVIVCSEERIFGVCFCWSIIDFCFFGF